MEHRSSSSTRCLDLVHRLPPRPRPPPRTQPSQEHRNTCHDHSSSHPEPRPYRLVLSRLRRLVRPSLRHPDRSRRPSPCHQHRRSPTSPPIATTSRAVSSGDSHAIERAKNPPAEANKSSDPHLRLTWRESQEGGCRLTGWA